jgi:small-conductance mechanosensitive channel
MSIFGWMVIVVGGSINVGDRIKVHRNGQEFVGDVLDISLFRITVQEDVTLTTVVVNRRAGRIIFIPNNYIFTEMISNYTHYGLKTVWDGVDITITFDSNHKKAVHLAQNICKQYAKGYIDITRTQLAKMRNKYDLRNSKLEPRVYTFIDNYGITVSSWFLNNSYATLALRSTISSEIVEAFLKEDDIFIAYPTQTIEMQRNRQKPVMEDMQQPSGKEDSPYSN